VHAKQFSSSCVSPDRSSNRSRPDEMPGLFPDRLTITVLDTISCQWEYT
jgi:hypothetical protein